MTQSEYSNEDEHLKIQPSEELDKLLDEYVMSDMLAIFWEQAQELVRINERDWFETVEFTFYPQAEDSHSVFIKVVSGFGWVFTIVYWRN